MAMRSLVLEYSNSSGALNSAAAESQLEQDSYVKGILQIQLSLGTHVDIFLKEYRLFPHSYMINCV